MGGDNAPDEIIEGVAEASQECDASYILIGDRKKIELAIERCQPRLPKVEILHTNEFIGMDESPRAALETKSHASIALAAQLVAEEKADALLSAGNTGAVVLAASKYIPMIEGVERGALAAAIPSTSPVRSDHRFTLLLDVGATIHCEAKHLVHFALMGHICSKYILGVENPHTGLLNIGEEDTKGGHILTQTYKLLKEIPDLNFIGNIEGNDFIRGAADVVVCEGFIGNVMVKMIEGVAETLVKEVKHAYRRNISYKLALAILSSGLKKLETRFDYAEYGGAPLLGFRRLCTIAHGRSNAKAVKNALMVTIKSLQYNVCERIHQSVKEFNQKLPFSEIEV